MERDGWRGTEGWMDEWIKRDEDDACLMDEWTERDGRWLNG